MSWPVISVAEMREWEAATWATGQTEEVVIARVGEVLARQARRMTHSGDGILLLAGKGHNGDDVRAMVPHLKERSVHLIEVLDPVKALAEFPSALRARPKLIVDGLFGIGLNRELDANWVKLIEGVNDARLPVLAVDVPSGLDAETGTVLPEAIRAAVTMTVGAPKRGFFASSAGDYVGRLEVATDVGLVPCPCASDLQWTTEDDFAAFPPPRPAGGHKGTFGHAALAAGSLGYHGAAVLAARGAQRARPGLVTLITQPDTYVPIAAQTQAVMVRYKWDSVKFTAIGFGPGLAAENLSPSVRETFSRVWNEATMPIIADASALDWLEPNAVENQSCRVITPHPGEAARLLGCSTAEIQRDRLKALRALSKRFGNCWVVLKGQCTLIGRATGNVFVNGSGNAGLAQGGTGDLLTGFITGWLAQPACQKEPLQSLRYAVWEHGAAADRLSERRRNWIVEELATELGG
jgi:NAD(P)H-hydrate epimerase